MPFSSRGAQYYGNAGRFLNCPADHELLADKLYGELVQRGEYYGTTTCENCGAYITVSARGTGEWETRIFTRGPGKER